MDTGYFKLDGVELDSNEEYRMLIGMMLYLSTNTRPDIAASVSILSQRVVNPRNVDMVELKRLIRYIKGTMTAKLRLSSCDRHGEFIGYSDANWGEDRKDRKSNSGYYTTLNGGAIAWCCRKQNIVTLSSAEAEYVALTETAKEMMWTRDVLKQFTGEEPRIMKIMTDSQSAMAMTDSQRFNQRSKHIDIRYHFIRDMVKKKELILAYVSTQVNIADMMTKPLGSNRIQQLREMAGIEEHAL